MSTDTLGRRPRCLPHTASVVVAALAALAGLVALAPAATAQEGLSVTVTPTTGLSDADTVSVDVEGIPDGQGIYLMFCVDVGGRASGDQCSDAQVWVSANAANQAFGAQSPADGPFDLEVASTFNGHDCREVACGVQTRRDHEGSDDTSLDTFTPVTFAPAVGGSASASETPSGPPKASETPTGAGPFAIAVSPTAGLADTDEVTVEVSGIPEDQGIYVQFCALPADGGRATGGACDGEGQGDSGVWVVADYPYPGTPPDGVVDPTDGPFTLPVRRLFHEVDCATVSCGIQTRRDHRGGGDTSLDTFTPVTFASAAPTGGVDDAEPAPIVVESLPRTGGGLAAVAGTLVAGAALLRRRPGRKES